MSERIHSALGFARRAGKLTIGDAACEKAVKSKKAFCVIIDSEASCGTLVRYARMCEAAKIPLITAASPGDAIGREEITVMAVTDGGFARMITDSTGVQ